MRATAALLLACFVMSGCATRHRDEDCACSEHVVDPVLLAFLSQARSAHHKADQQEAAGDSAGALRSLEQLTSSPRPPGAPPEVDEVLADTQARIADLLSQAGRFDQAASAIESGLEHAKTTTYFRGHLFEVRGLVEERRDKALRAKGRGREADEARRRSLDAYEEAMKVQAAVIATSAPSAPSATPGASTHP
jgi:tetratricopeptide (TPR) repeat protein